MQGVHWRVYKHHRSLIHAKRFRTCGVYCDAVQHASDINSGAGITHWLRLEGTETRFTHTRARASEQLNNGLVSI